MGAFDCFLDVLVDLWFLVAGVVVCGASGFDFGFVGYHLW